jgi:anti-sigma factor RsiW
MRDRHWTQDELVARLFDDGPEDEHLIRCPECARRWEAVKERRRGLAAAVEAGVSEEKLAAQRRVILSRMKNRKHKFSAFLAPSFAAAALIVLAVLFFFRPAPPPDEPVLDTVVGDEVMEEVFQTSYSLEPAALVPVRELFEEQQ